MVSVRLMTAAMRRGLVPRPMPPAARLLARRSLGDTTRGPPLKDLNANFRLATEFFTKGSISYAEYKAQCVSLRLFAFAAVSAGCVVGLAVNPPKSSYWATWGPVSWLYYIKGGFSNDSPPLFLTSKAESVGDVKKIVRSHVSGSAEAGFSPAAAKAAAPAKAEPAEEAPAEAAAPAEEAAAPAAAPAAAAPAAAAATPVVRNPACAKCDILNAEETHAAFTQVYKRENPACGKCDILNAEEKHAAFVFIKPHAVTDQVKYLLKLKLKGSGISVISEGKIEAEQIDKEQLIDTHYGAIAAKAVKLKPDALTVQPKAQDAFQKAFGEKWEDAVKSGKVYNAMDGAEKLGLSFAELTEEWSKLKKDVNLLKFGGGFYCGEVKGLFVINGFYMDMRNSFTKPGTCIHYYEVEWNPKDLSWADFRAKVLGGTDPKTAHSESARHLIYQNWEGLGLSAVPNTGDNGVHASASPFEALSERCNWLGRDISQDFYGKALLASDVPVATMKAWCDDPPVSFEGKKQSIFDLLEDMNSADCLRKAGEIAGASK